MGQQIDLAKLPLRHSFNEVFYLNDTRMTYKVEDTSWMITLTDEEEKMIWEDIPMSFINNFKWDVRIHNVTKSIYVYLDNFDLNMFTKTSRNKLSPNKLSFSREFFRGNYKGYDFDTMFEINDIIELDVIFQGGLAKTVFKGRVKAEKKGHGNIKQKISVEAFDDTLIGYYRKFDKNEVLANYYVCNNADKPNSLLHQLAYRMGFLDADLSFDNVTDDLAAFIQIPYVYLAEDGIIMEEMSSIAQAFSGDLFMDVNLKLRFKIIHEDEGLPVFTLDKDILQKKLMVEKTIVKYNSAKVIYDTYREEPKQVVFRLQGKNGTEDDAKIVVAVGTDTTSNVYWGIKYISGFVVSLDASFTTSGYYFNDLENRVNVDPLVEGTHYEIEYDSGGGRIKFLNPLAYDLYIEKFEIQGNPVYKFSNNEYQITQNGVLDVDRKTLENRYKYIQSKEMAKVLCEQLYIKNCMEYNVIKGTLNLAFNLEPLMKVEMIHHDYNGEMILVDLKHKNVYTEFEAYENVDHVFTNEILNELESGSIDTTLDAVYETSKSLDQRVYDLEQRVTALET